MTLNDLARYYELRMNQAMRMEWAIDLHHYHGWSLGVMVTLCDWAEFMHEADEIGDTLTAEVLSQSRGVVMNRADKQAQAELIRQSMIYGKYADALMHLASAMDWANAENDYALYAHLFQCVEAKGMARELSEEL